MACIFIQIHTVYANSEVSLVEHSRGLVCMILHCPQQCGKYQYLGFDARKSVLVGSRTTKATNTVPGPEVIKLISCSTQLSMKFQMLIESKMLKNKDLSCFQPLRCCIYHAHKSGWVVTWFLLGYTVRMFEYTVRTF